MTWIAASRITFTTDSGGGCKQGRVFVYFPDGKLAMEVGGTVDDAPTKYLTADHLGSTRIVTRADKTVANRFDFAPYGEELAATLGGRTEAMGYGALAQPFQVSTKEPRQRFTGHYRDFETGLDYFGARYYTAVGGRFISPDAPFADQFAEDPQSWNLYGYVRNNPLANVDEDGNKTADAATKTVTKVGTEIVLVTYAKQSAAAAVKAALGVLARGAATVAASFTLVASAQGTLGEGSDASKIIAATNAKKQAETDTGKTEETKEEKAAEPDAGGRASANALKTQIWTALIALLLIRYLQLRSRLQWHLSRFAAVLRHQLFVYRDLWRFLDLPFEGPPPLRSDYLPPQPGLFTNDFGHQPTAEPDTNPQPHPPANSDQAVTPLPSTLLPLTPR